MTQQELHYLLLNILALFAIIRIIVREVRNYKKRKQYTPQRKKKRSGGFKPKKWYPTGWTWNEEKQLWEPPDYLAEQSQENWVWNEEEKNLDQ